MCLLKAWLSWHGDRKLFILTRLKVPSTGEWSSWDDNHILTILVSCDYYGMIILIWWLCVDKCDCLCLFKTGHLNIIYKVTMILPSMFFNVFLLIFLFIKLNFLFFIVIFLNIFHLIFVFNNGNHYFNCYFFKKFNL